MSTTGNDRLVPLTDDRGRLLVPEEEAYEPLPGSIVLGRGPHGTAWQRYFSDGLWHSVNGAVRNWEQMLRERQVLIVHDAPERN